MKTYLKWTVVGVLTILFIAMSFYKVASTFAAQETDKNKIAICHIPVGNPKNFHTIYIDENAAPTHLAHGDRLGLCSSWCEVLCDDGNACTQKQCGDQGGCKNPLPVNCDDGLKCTADSCDKMVGCIHKDTCDDNNQCNGKEICGINGCQIGIPLVCNDGNPCTDDSCSPVSGCMFTKNTISCDDCNACTTIDTCSEGSCVGGSPLICTDDKPFTEDLCDPAVGCTFPVIANILLWTPIWGPSNTPANKSFIDVVQGLPGYSLIGGKNTLVAFTPYSPGMNPDASLDIYKLHPWGVDLPEAKLHGLPAVANIECESQTGRCAEMNFFVDWEFVKEPGDYLFVITWSKEGDSKIRTDWVWKRFREPAVQKILFVRLGTDVFGDALIATWRSIMHYFSRMPFSEYAIKEIGPAERYWDVFVRVINENPEWFDTLGQFNPSEEAVLNAVTDALREYNLTATIPAQYAVGLHSYLHFNAAGFTPGWGRNISICEVFSHGTCTHEIGHLLERTEEPSDMATSIYTCGYFYEEFDNTIGCKDWAWDPATQQVYSQPLNAMSHVGNGDTGFFTRHFYETACIVFGGSCEALEGDFRLSDLNMDRYLDNNPQTDEVFLMTPADYTPRWHAKFFRRSPNGKRYVKLHTSSPIYNCGGLCFTLLIGNPSTGELKKIPLEYSSQFGADWCQEWEVDQITSDIVTLYCEDSHYPLGDGGFLQWDTAQGGVRLKNLTSIKRNEEHWTPSLQWRISKGKPYSGYPD